ncbi:ribosome small subunit-dependent GTPase A [Robertkochia flava]|uniref:ribosome small subunit-dependent GTPase A n=1 Tax=Robertkochia flava TaxID=3447986 RepID=UPI001CCB75E4|nr:ribosome small subunit-dependent GTPase A [Robertkochia marina]
MTLQDLGYHDQLDPYIAANGLGDLLVGRVVTEHKERYVVKTPEAEYEAEILGNLRFTAQSRADFPAVGDWVMFQAYDRTRGLIHAVLPRTSILERQSVSRKGEKQIIATNIDRALIVQAADRDFSINRLERYLTICNASQITPVIVLNKTDLIPEAGVLTLLEEIRKRISGVDVYAVSNKTGSGMEALKQIFERGKTYCLLGSSGVGKSSLLNTLMGEELMKSDDISEHSNRGRHVTTHRELRVLAGGGILIDNPGMREIGITDASGALEVTFDGIQELAANCRFRDCTHTSEQGCAVLAAVDNGDLSAASYDNFLKMQREKQHFEATVAEKRKRDKEFGKMVKHIMKNKRK